jgi:serine/threonine protein kinase
MNTDNWTYYYKQNAHGDLLPSNILYTPLLNPERDIMCMHYIINENYQGVKEGLTQEVVDFFFQREVKYLKALQHWSFTPDIIEIDEENNKIFIEWNNETLSQIVNNPVRELDQEILNWGEEIFDILKTLKEEGYLKVALYPHCFFMGKDGHMKTIDYYSVMPIEDRFIDRDFIEGMIGKEGAYRFDRSTKDGKIDFLPFLKITMREHLREYWQTNIFAEWYTQLYEENPK